MSAEERMKRELRVVEASVEGYVRCVTAAVSDTHGVVAEPQLLESVASSPSEMYICVSRKNSLRARRCMYEASLLISIPY